MLIDSLYIIDQIEEKGQNHYTVSVKLDKTHTIFSGHFPGQAVLPGVCIIEMVKEIISIITKQDHILSNANNIKFLSLVDPHKNDHLTFEMILQDKDPDLSLSVSSALTDGTVNFKMKATYKKA